MFKKYLWQFDRRVAAWVELIPATVRPFFEFLAPTTHPAAWWIVLCGAIAIDWLVSKSGQLNLFVLTLIALPVGPVLKYVFRRTRPETMYVENMRFRSYSFPSGHAYSAALVSGMFAAMSQLLIFQPLSYFVSSAFILLAAAIGISRIYLGAHFPSDVLGGWVLGVAMLALVLKAANL